MSNQAVTANSNQTRSIAEHGLIGDLHTSALVDLDGSIVWLCWPHHDSPPVFGALLDPARGGRFQIAPEDEPYQPEQHYDPGTNVLSTRFTSAASRSEVLDFMLVPVRAASGGRIIRRVTVETGQMRFAVVCRPAFLAADYQDFGPHSVEQAPNRVRFDAPHLSLELLISPPGKLEVSASDGIGYSATLTLQAGESVWFVLREAPRRGLDESGDLHEEDYAALLQETLDYWRTWLVGCSYQGDWQEQVRRSVLTLKLMTFEPTGAIIAAPTSSLPEHIEGGRNWDYRYCFLRDASFSVDALMNVGLYEEVAAFLNWLVECVTFGPEGGDPPRLLRPLYTLYGETRLRGLPAGVSEVECAAYAGYCGSRPVRFGNAAADQLQLDVYGEVLYAAHRYVAQGGQPISDTLWDKLHTIVDWVCQHWQSPDRSCWEIRGDPKHFTFSRLMCWVAVDRGLRLAALRSLPLESFDHWQAARDTIYQEVMQRGVKSGKGPFVQYYGGNELDASSLLLGKVGFISPHHPLMRATIEAIKQPFGQGGLMSGGMIYRYDWTKIHDLGQDHPTQPENPFNLCSLWLVEAMARTGDPDYVGEAKAIFERMLEYANHLGLYAEETGSNGEALGNFPQALSHLGLINAAIALDRALSDQDPNLAQGGRNRSSHNIR